MMAAMAIPAKTPQHVALPAEPTQAQRFGKARTAQSGALLEDYVELISDLLESNGVAALADVMALSCEVGAFKPATEIYTFSLDQLGVPARRAVFVDDQPSFCAGAAALGITAVQIVRGERDGKVPAPGTTVVRSLREVGAMF